MPITDATKGANTGSPANLFEQRASSPETAGKLVTATRGSNSTAAGGQQFEQKTADPANPVH